MGMLYRVRVKSTHSLQPSGSFWHNEVLYCGNSVEMARETYHANEPADFYQGPGNPCRETIFEKMETTDLKDDDPGKMEEVEVDK